MCFKTIRLFFVPVSLFLLAACGGGGSGTAGSSDPYIFFAVDASNKGAGASLQYSAWGNVNETSSMNSLPITDAIVTINNVTLTYEASTRRYVANGLPPTLVDANGKLNLTVIARGKTYTSTQDAPDTLPILSVPNPVVAASATTVSWSQNVSTHGLIPTSYWFMASISGATGGTTIYQAMTTSTSVNFPANTFTPGITYYFGVVSSYSRQSIANTDPLSGFFVSAVPVSISRTVQ